MYVRAFRFVTRRWKSNFGVSFLYSNQVANSTLLVNNIVTTQRQLCLNTFAPSPCRSQPLIEAKCFVSFVASKTPKAKTKSSREKSLWKQYNNNNNNNTTKRTNQWRKPERWQSWRKTNSSNSISGGGDAKTKNRRKTSLPSKQKSSMVKRSKTKLSKKLSPSEEKRKSITIQKQKKIRIAEQRRKTTGKGKKAKVKAKIKKCRRMNAYQRQRVKYNKRVTAIANLWKEHKEAERINSIPKIHANFLNSTSKLTSQQHTTSSQRLKKKK